MWQRCFARTKTPSLMQFEREVASYPRFVTLPVESVRSHWYEDLMSDWQPDRTHIVRLLDTIAAGEPVAPILVVKERDNYVVVDGHNRIYAYREAGIPQIQAVLIEGDFEGTEDLRMADLRLKAFDEKTGHRYGFSAVSMQWEWNHADGSLPTRAQRAKLFIVMFRRILAKARRRLVRLAFR